MASWLVGRSVGDVRFLLRAVLHGEQFAEEHYDWVILDCPPRWTTASINGLCSSDFVLIPVVPDVLSVRSLPQILRWLRKFKTENLVCPEIDLIGIIANLTRHKTALTPEEEDAFSDQASAMQKTWGSKVHIFSTFLSRSKLVSDAVDKNEFAALTSGSSFRKHFEVLVNEMVEQVNGKVVQSV